MGKLKESNFIEITPRPSLNSIVETLWYSRATAEHVLRILPTTCTTLMTCETPYGAGIVLVGPMSAACVVQLDRGNTKVGIRFKPGTRFRFSAPKKDMSSLRDKVIPGRDTPLNGMYQLEKAVNETSSIRQKIEYLQDYTEKLLQEGYIVRDKLVDEFIHKAETTNGQTTVSDALYNTPISYQQFNRRFKQYTGFTPKEYLVLQRLHAAANSLDATERPITTVAASHGYADHAHLTRDFQSFAGILPSEFKDHQTL